MFLSLLLLLLKMLLKSIIICCNPDSLSRILKEQWCIGNYTTLTAVAYWKLCHSNLFSEIVSNGKYPTNLATLPLTYFF